MIKYYRKKVKKLVRKKEPFDPSSRVLKQHTLSKILTVIFLPVSKS